MYYVIGSGPSGVACAAALIAAGQEVTLLDAGLTLESAREERRIRMAAVDPDQWNHADVVASTAVAGEGGSFAAKLCHGSDYPYRTVYGGTDIDYGELEFRGSYAKGGLSNVWGAALLPFRSEDTKDWPIAVSDLDQAHAAVLEMLPVAGVRDELTQLFPLTTSLLEAPRRCAQIESFLVDLKRNQKRLADSGILFGAARAAVRFSGFSSLDSCNYCGRCMQGCPRDLIYSSRHTLAEMVAAGKLTYRHGVVVNEIEEHEGGVIIHASKQGGDSLSFHGKRVYLGAGVVNSTAILLRSLGWYGRSVDIADSQYFMLPILRIQGAPDVLRERLFTLAQLFIEISNSEISPHTVHLQIYGFSDMLADMLDFRLGALKRWVPRKALLSRLLIIQGFLHSSHSGRIRAILRRQNRCSKLELQGIGNPDAEHRVSLVIRKLRRLAPILRAIPLGSLVQMAAPGRSFHSGGSFPMARNPREGQTDTLGRPQGMSRVHVVDSTVFPSIPATTITQTVMANAYRIGTQSVQLDSRVFS